MPISKRPGATATRALKALNTPAEEEDVEEEEEEELEPLHRLLEGNVGISEVSNSKV